MKKLIFILIAFVLIDGLLRSGVEACFMSGGQLNKKFLTPLLALTTIFIVGQSWFYVLIALIYSFVAHFISTNKNVFIVLGFFTALLFYLYYFYKLSAFEFEKYQFLIRIIQYPLFGSIFGYYYYQYRISKEE